MHENTGCIFRMKAVKGYISEVFGSFQGEGPYLGERHVFVRLCGCNLECAYCDTADARSRQPMARLDVGRGMGDISVPNPLPVERVVEAVLAQEERPGFNAALTLTGGEPLMQPGFIHALLAALDGRFRVILETNGTLTRAFGAVRPLVDVVSMDIKLPSVGGQGPLWGRHTGFIKACGGKELIVKAVVSEDTPEGEVERAARLVAGLAPDALLVLQPLTRAKGRAVSSGSLDIFYRAAMRHLRHVRVIPQTHKHMGVR